MIRINLLAEKKTTRARTARVRLDAGLNAQVFVLILSMLVSLVYVGWQWRTLTAEREGLNKRITEAEVEAKRLESVNKRGKELKEKRGELQEKVELITELKNNQSGPVHMLDQLSRNLPDFVWLEKLNESSNNLKIVGRATTYNAVSNFYNNLTGSPYFVKVDLGTTSEVKEGVSFSITCRFVAPAKRAAETQASSEAESS
ncbi:MAG: PilN domain-containing protein [Acidobacteriota bacterium]